MSDTERRLSPAQPFLMAGPLSWLDADGGNWSLLAHNDLLVWGGLGPNPGPGEIGLFFFGINTASPVLITLRVIVESVIEEGGSYQVRSTFAQTRVFPVTGFREDTVALVVRSEGVPFWVGVRPQQGMAMFAFHEATYWAL